MVCDSLLDLTNLELFLAIAPEQSTSGHRNDSAPVRQNLRDADDHSLHLDRLDELADDAILQHLDDLAEVDNARVLVEKELAESLCDS